MQSESKEIDNETCAHHAPVNNYLFTINNKSTRESSMKNVAWNRSRLFFIFKESSVKKESKEVCMLIWIYFDIFAVTYLI